MLGSIRQSLDQPYLNVELPAADDFLVRIVECPALWMPEDELDALQADLRRIARLILGPVDLDYGIFAVGSDALESTVITCIRRKADYQAVAFNALPLLEIELDSEPVQVQHLGLVMIDPDTQGKGLSWALYGLTCFLLFFRTKCRPMWISNVTQVPAVLGMVAETFSDVYPNPAKSNMQRFSHRQIASQIVRKHYKAFGVARDVDFDASNSILRDSYTGGSDLLKKTFEQTAKHRNKVFNDWCLNALDYGRGDDVLQVGLLDMTTARRFLVKAVPGPVVGPLLVKALIMLVQHATLPMLHWLDTSRRFGTLRP